MPRRGLFLDPLLEERLMKYLNSKYTNEFEFGDIIVNEFNDTVHMVVDGKETSLWFSINVLELLTDEELESFSKKIEKKLKKLGVLLIPKGNVYLKILKHNKNK